MSSDIERAETEDEPLGGVEIAFPLELSVEGVPLSLQASADSKKEWKAVIAQKARSSLREGAWLTEAPVSVTILYFPDGPMIGDVDNIVKLSKSNQVGSSVSCMPEALFRKMHL